MSAARPEEPTSCLQTAESKIPRKIRPGAVLTCGTLGQNRVPIEYRWPTKTIRFAGISSDGANRDRTGDLLLAKQALSQLSYGPWEAKYTRSRASFRSHAASRSAGSEVVSAARLPITAN